MSFCNYIWNTIETSEENSLTMFFIQTSDTTSKEKLKYVWQSTESYAESFSYSGTNVLNTKQEYDKYFPNMLLILLTIVYI